MYENGDAGSRAIMLAIYFIEWNEKSIHFYLLKQK